MSRTLALFAWSVIALVLGFPSERTGAFEVVSTGTPNEYLKWGPSHQAGSSGGVVTWGLLSVGTPGSSYCSTFCVGASTDVLPHFYATPDINNVTTPVKLAALEAVIEQAFDAWSAVADVEFRYVGEGSRLQDFPTGGGLYMSDVYLLALHEIGHVIGLAGSNDPESLMWNGGPSAVLRPTYMWRTPRADDIAGARFLYGAPRKPGVP